MCKVFKIKTKTGLVTTTTDQSIVNCLIDNYDDELVITIGKKSEEKIEHKERFCFTLPAYPGHNRLEYLKELKETLNISLIQAKCLVDDGGKVFRNNLDEANYFEDMLRKYKMDYVKTICKPDENQYISSYPNWYTFCLLCSFTRLGSSYIVPRSLFRR